MLRKWGFRLEEQRKTAKNVIKSDVIYRILLQKRVFRRILAFKEKNQKEKQIKHMLFTRKNQEIVRNSLRIWVFSAKILRNQRIIENDRYLSNLKEVFGFFKRNFIHKKTKRFHRMALERFLEMKIRNSLDLCFRNWKTAILKKKRKQNVMNFIDNKENFSFEIRFFRIISLEKTSEFVVVSFVKSKRISQRS